MKIRLRIRIVIDFCQTSHGAAAAAHLGKNSDLVEQVKCDFLHASVSEKLKALLLIAGQVQQGGKTVSSETLEKARLRAQLTLRSTIPSSLLPPSACITATSMVLPHGNLVIQRCIPAWVSISPPTGTSRRQSQLLLWRPQNDHCTLQAPGINIPDPVMFRNGSS
jgi:hypothetical protein